MPPTVRPSDLFDVAPVSKMFDAPYLNQAKQMVNNRQTAMNTKTKNAADKQPKIGGGKERRLTVQQERFCERIAAGDNQTEAWLNAGYKVSREVAAVNANESLRKPKIKARIAELRQPQTKAALRKKEDNLRYLAEIIGTALADIGPDSPLCVEFTEDLVGRGNRGKLRRGKADSGNEITEVPILRRRVKKPCPLRAIEIYSRLLGHFEPDRVEVEAGPKTLLSIKERATQLSSALIRKYEAAYGQ